MIDIKNYPAGENVLLVLTGLGGSLSGYGEKYIKIAQRASREYGFTTSVAAVTEDVWADKERAFDEIFSRTCSAASTAYIMGSSAGASLALWYAHKYKNVAKVLCINPVLNVNLPLTVKGMNEFKGEKVYIVSGNCDPSFVWAKMIKCTDRVEVRILENVDHFFTGKSDEFIALPFELLFN